jgi:hypothetical protein
MNLFEMFEQPATFKDALTDFLPMCVDHLQLNQLPKIAFQKDIDVTSFGTYDANTDTITLVLHNRQPVDILRTLAHELVHAQQRQSDKIKPGDGQTGSPIEDEANAEAGVIMRVFAQEYPKYLTLPAVTIPSQLEEKRKRKKKAKRRAYSGGYYGYYYGDANSDSGDSGGGESMYEGFASNAALVVALASAIATGPAHAEGNPVAQAIGIARQVNKMKGYGPDAARAEAYQELYNLVKAVGGQGSNQSKIYPLIKDMINTPEQLPTEPEKLPPMTLPGDAVQENFADGKNPQDKGDSQRHGIPKGATMAELEKAAKAPGRKGQLARWQINMRRGRNK